MAAPNSAISAINPINPIDSYRQLADARRDFLEAVTEAVARARATGGPGTLVSRSLQLPLAVDLPRAWAAARQLTDDAFLWLSAWGGPGIATAGRAARFDAAGAARFTRIREAWTRLTGAASAAGPGPGPGPGSGSGPVLVGGFAFAPGEEGRMILPAVQFSELPGGGTVLTVNALVDPGTDPARLTEDRFDLAGLLIAAGPLPAPRPGPSRVDRDERPEAFRQLVADAVSAIRDGAFDKVVVARKLQVRATTGEFSVPDAVRRLMDSYAGSTVFAVHSRDESGERCFLGATPEYLVRLTDGTAEVLGLAGSAPRGATPDEDELLASGLLTGDKLRREHGLVTSMLETSLARMCTGVETEDGPGVLRLANIQHLATRIRGRLLDPARTGVLDLAGQLHPTPALGGHPSGPALEWLRANEPLDRGWYAAPVGWTGADGGGEFAVAIRSALVSGRHAALYAGCGIVEGSEPEAEYQETCAKLLAMSCALGLPPVGEPAAPAAADAVATADTVATAHTVATVAGALR
jgi:isochorismate synthase